jgi:hypothetical protein
MNKFKELKSNFQKKNKFQDIVQQLMNKENIELGKSIIDALNCDSYLNARDLLSVFLLHKFPKDTLGELSIDTNKNVYDSIDTLLKSNFQDNESFKIKLIKFVYYFKDWKKEDLSILKNQLFNEYHQLTVDIANCEEEEEEKKIIFEETQKKILECAHQIDGTEFVNEIQSYKPILINTQDLQKQYDKAYYDVFIKEFEEKKYEKIIGLLEFIKITLKALKPSEAMNLEKNIDLPYIHHKLNFDKFSNIMGVELFDYILDVIKMVQSSANDKQLEKIKVELKIKEIFIPDILIKIMGLITNIIHDLENIQSSMKKK